MHIRDEQSDDARRISEIHYAAFKGHPQHEPGAEPVEHLIVERLRAANALSLSLVATDNSEAIGHIAMSPACLGEAESGWHLLGPVGVVPGRQGNGVGSALIREALQRMKKGGAAGIVLVGDPKYYARFDFQSVPGLNHPGVPDENVLALPFGDETPQGAITAHEAFHQTP